MIRALCVWSIVFITGGCGRNVAGPHHPAKQMEQSKMAKSIYIPKLEYRIYGSNYRALAHLDESGQAQITAVETIEGEEVPPAKEGAELDDEAKEQLNKILGPLGLGAWTESLVVTETRAVLILDARGAAWDAATLEKEGPPRELRKWAEANLNLALHTSELARKRAAKAEDSDDIKKAAQAYKEAIDRLERWWIPEGPVRDETGTIYSDGIVCLQHEDYSRAVDRFIRVLEKRSVNYRKKYER